MIKVKISAIRPGDRVARTRSAEPREVAGIEPGAKRTKLTFADGSTAQAAPGTIWWLDAEASAEAEGKGEPRTTEAEADALLLGTDTRGQEAGADTRSAGRRWRSKANGKREQEARRDGGRVTFFDAAEQVLRAAGGPMKARAIAEQAIPLVSPPPTAKKPVVYLTANMHVDAKNGGRFVKTAPGTFDVRELNPRGAAKRPAQRNGKNGGRR